MGYYFYNQYNNKNNPNHNDLKTLIACSDITVAPSIFPEAFGLVAVEAMSAARTVIGAAHGGITEIIDHERNGLLFTPGNHEALADCIRKIIHNRDILNKYGQEGRKDYINKFSENLYDKNFRQTFQTALKTDIT